VEGDNYNLEFEEIPSYSFRDEVNPALMIECVEVANEGNSGVRIILEGDVSICKLNKDGELEVEYYE
jgi:hypothetical protein